MLMSITGQQVLEYVIMINVTSWYVDEENEKIADQGYCLCGVCTL